VFIWYNDIDVFYIENKVDICIYLHKLYIQIYILYQFRSSCGNGIEEIYWK
jgi:hypothetical protein